MTRPICTECPKVVPNTRPGRCVTCSTRCSRKREQRLAGEKRHTTSREPDVVEQRVLAAITPDRLSLSVIDQWFNAAARA